MSRKFVDIREYIIVQPQFLQEECKHYEGIFAQGNGYFHVRGNFEEGLMDAPQDERYVRTMNSVTTEIQRHPLSKNGTFLPLIMGKNPFLEEVIINLPFFMAIRIYAGDEKLDMLTSEIKEFSRVLDMQTGELIRTFTWITKRKEEIQLEFRRFASMKQLHLFVQKVTITSRSKVRDITIVSGIDGTVTTNGYCHFTESYYGGDDDRVWCQVKTDMGEEVAIESRCQLSGQKGMNLQMNEITKSNNDVYNIFKGTMDNGQGVTITKYTGIGCSRDENRNFKEEITSCVTAAVQMTYEQLLLESSRIWEERWKKSDIKIDGCRQLQDGIRFSIYHLLRCSTMQENRIQICAKGFAGEAYYGRYFWDTEMYLLPYYLYSQPDTAKSLLLYRYHTLKGAKENAKKYHCRGARYPWQSGLTGTEQCSLWEYADNEVHITADIAFAIMHYYKATKDKEFLFQYGIEILLETAKFWLDRVDCDEEGVFHLLNVMGPDEYSPMTKDNGFTNRMVKYNLDSAVEMLEIIKEEAPDQFHNIMKKTNVQQEDLSKMKEIANTLPIPYDKNRDLYLQSADFEQYAKIDLDKFWKDKNKAFGHFVSQEKIYRSRCIKQADTIALMSIFGNEFTDKQAEIAYEYYKPMTTHDSSLSPAVHTLIANRIGKQKDVEEFVNKSLAVDLDVVKKGAEDGIHIANCGALWQMVMQGFLGMSPGYLSEKLKITPKLPTFISSIEARIMWQGKPYYVHVTKDNATIEEVLECR